MLKIVLALVFVSLGVIDAVNPALLMDLKKMELLGGSGRVGKAEPPATSSEVKRAQEEMFFGNQQNKGVGSHPAKRAADIPEVPVPDVQNVLDKEDSLDQIIYPEDVRRRMQQWDQDTYYDSGNNNGVFEGYDEDEEDRQKRSVKSHRSRIITPYGHLVKRSKRQMDPEELMTLLGYWEAEQQRRKHQNPLKHGHRYYDQRENERMYPSYDQLNEIQENGEGVWLNNPVFPNNDIRVRYAKPHNWQGNEMRPVYNRVKGQEHYA